MPDAAWLEAVIVRGRLREASRSRLIPMGESIQPSTAPSSFSTVPTPVTAAARMPTPMVHLAAVSPCGLQRHGEQDKG